MNKFLKKLSGSFSLRAQQNLKRVHFGRLISRNKFRTDEPEASRLNEWIKEGDWVLDVGANVGHYTKLFSDLVGGEGRVIALEPVPNTFELLSANIAQFTHQNITLLNVAASDACSTVQMAMPKFDTGLNNYYQASIREGLDDGMQVLAISVDSISIKQKIALVKVDVEGHELKALQGMRQVLERDKPTLIVEGRDPAVQVFLEDIGYGFQEDIQSPNRVFFV